jgi:histidine ammonia-lyase
VPEPKEGLCLINGTQVMCAVGLLVCHDALRLVRAADVACAVTLDATRGTPTAFRPEIHAARPHLHQGVSARNVLRLLEDDAIAESHRTCHRVQDPYSIRCTPQVHGAIRAALAHALETLLVEANSSTDNPLVFADTDEILSGGNFHGEPVALVLDYLAMGLSELSSVSERRLEKLVNPNLSGLPPFLAKDSGLNSGHMITHVVAAALVNENKTLCWPASVDSIPTSADKEDHVSMGMTSANKLRRIVDNTSRVLAIELIAGADGVELHAPTTGGRGVRAAWQWVRNFCPPLIEDRSLSKDIERAAERLLSGELESAIAVDCGVDLE